MLFELFEDFLFFNNFSDNSLKNNVEEREEDLIEIDCPSNHFYCYSCLKKCFDQYRKENEIIRCHSKICSYRFKSKDFQRIFLRFQFDEKIDQLKLICQICFEENSLSKIFFHRSDEEDFLCFQCLNKDLIDQMSKNQWLKCRFCDEKFIEKDLPSIEFCHYQNKKQIEFEINQQTYLLQCPNGFCHWSKQIEKNSKRIRIECPQCSFVFCSSCTDQYHYHIDCHRIPSILQHFLLFIDQFSTSSMSKITENSSIKRRYDQFVQDEIYKSEFCRHCPSCQRLIEYSDGCQTIVCGENAHQFNQKQIGCRKIFRWFDAQFYQSTIQFKLNQISIENQHFQCDQCRRQIDGIRFQCIHCPSLSFCFNCHQQSIDNHWKENQRQNEKEHLFSLIPFYSEK